jgi:hypothetical protein
MSYYKEFDKKKYKKFQKAYKEAVKGKKSSLTFGNDFYDIGYAKYVLEDLKGRFETKK